MLCSSQMLSTLKLQQQMTLQNTHFINACSPEKQTKNVPSVDCSNHVVARLLFPGRHKDIWSALTKPSSQSTWNKTYTLLHQIIEKSISWLRGWKAARKVKGRVWWSFGHMKVDIMRTVSKQHALAPWPATQFSAAPYIPPDSPP